MSHLWRRLQLARNEIAGEVLLVDHAELGGKDLDLRPEMACDKVGTDHMITKAAPPCQSSYIQGC